MLSLEGVKRFFLAVKPFLSLYFVCRREATFGFGAKENCD